MKTITIKQVPKALTDGLRRRAAANHRSQQRELLLILEAALAPPAPGVLEPLPQPYVVKASASKIAGTIAPKGAGKLTLEQLWQRARKLGAACDESADIIRRDRDARHGR